MVEEQSNRVYKVFGLKVSSEIDLPELVDIGPYHGPVDAAIRMADLSREWADTGGGDQQFAVHGDKVMFNIAQAAQYLVQDGNTILISPVEGASEDRIRLYLLGSCMGALLIQRRVLPLHGSAVAIDGKAFAFVGRSGAGKSTLASAFVQQGYPFMTDDVIAVSLSDEGIPYATPAYPQQKLWQESLAGFGMNPEQYRPLLQRLNKYAIPVQNRYYGEPLPLAGVFEIIPTENGDIQLSRIENMMRFHVLFAHTFRKKLIGPLGLMGWHFNFSAKMVNQLDIFRLERPASGFTANQMASLILETIKVEATL